VASGGAFFSAGDFASVSVQTATVKLNDTGSTFDPTTLDATLTLPSVAHNVRSVSVVGLQADFAGFVSVSGNFGFEISGVPGSEIIDATANQVAASLSLGAFEAGISGGTLALRLDSAGGIALETGLGPSGALVLTGAGFNGVTFNDVKVQYNNSAADYSVTNLDLDIDGVTASLTMGSGSPQPLIGVRVIGLQAGIDGVGTITGRDAAGLSVMNAFTFQRGPTDDGRTVVKVLVENVGISLGSGLIDVNGGNGAMLITEQGIAAQIDATVDFVALQPLGMTMGGSFHLAINNIPEAVEETFTIGLQPYTLAVPAGPFLRVEANPATLTIPLAPPQTVVLQGNIFFEQSQKSNGDEIVIVSLSEIEVLGGFSGPGTGGMVDIVDARGTLVILPDGFAGTLTFTASGQTGGFGLGADLKFEINKSPNPVDVSGPFGSVLLPAGPNYFNVAISNLVIAFGDNILIEGDFSVGNASGATKEVIIGNNISIFVGDVDPGPYDFDQVAVQDAVGLVLTDGTAVLLREGELEAGFITGRVQLVGVPGVEFDATMTFRINEFTTGHNESFAVDGENVSIMFDETDEIAKDVLGTTRPFVQFGGEDILFSVLDVVALRGNFTFTRKTFTNTSNRRGFAVGVTDTEVFVGAGSAWLPDGSVNPDAIGALVSNIQLSLVVFTDDGAGNPTTGKYAFSGTGELGFVGLPDLGIDPNISFGMALNRTGIAFSETIPILGHPDVTLSFADASDLPVFSGFVEIGIPDAFGLSGTFNVRPLPSGEVEVLVDSATLSIGDTTDPTFEVTGKAAFRFGGIEGFRLSDFRLTTVKVFGTTLSLDVLSLNPRSLTANLVSPFGHPRRHRPRASPRWPTRTHGASRCLPRFPRTSRSKSSSRRTGPILPGHQRPPRPNVSSQST
jgi:hypothetical protein